MSDAFPLPKFIPNWIDHQEQAALEGESLVKHNPGTGQPQSHYARSRQGDIARAVASAKKAQPAWASTPPVTRGQILHELAMGMRRHKEEIARIVALETGKSFKEALGETEGAILQGMFMAGEGQRLYGRTTTSGQANKYAMTIRMPIGVAGLIIAANTPIANVSWKIFPALICGNAAVLKAPEDTPATAWIVGRIARETGLPPGVLNIVQGLGEEAGAPLVSHPDVGVISFTGSTEVGRRIAVEAGQRLARVSLELGGKNPLIVCDDADLDLAVKWICLSAFSNAGQRCAAGSRIIVFRQVYDILREKLLTAVSRLRVGLSDQDDFGPVINEQQLQFMLGAVETARQGGGILLCGGHRLSGPGYDGGYFLAPTLMEGIAARDPLSLTELFGPIATLYQVENFQEAMQLANASPYGLTAAIHTRNYHRAIHFAQQVQAGVAVVNAGTYGSEPHMPFGGMRMSGNGSREPGTEALEVYSELKDIYMVVDSTNI